MSWAESMGKTAQRFTRCSSLSPAMRHGLASVILIGLVLVESFNPSVRVLKRGCQRCPEDSKTSLVPLNCVRFRNFHRCGASQQNTKDERIRISSFSYSLWRSEARCAATHDSNAPNAENHHPSSRGSRGCCTSLSEGSTAAADSNGKMIGVRSDTSRPCMDNVTAAGRRPSKTHRQQKEPRRQREKGKGGSWQTGLEEVFVSRRQLLGAVAAMGTVAMLVKSDGVVNAATEAELGAEEVPMLVWSPRSEIIKRAPATGGTVAPGSNETYPIRFITYLARFLLNYDTASCQLWESMARKIPMDFSTLEVEAVRRDQFAEFAKAVQVGLVDYQGPQGIKALFSLMCSRYGQGEESKRQLAILFSFLEEGQPTDLMKGLLGQVDNGQVSSLVITDPGGGYTGAIPKVTISASQAGKQAKARAIVRETGHLVGIRIPEGCEYSYKTPPMVRVSPPSDPTGIQAEARAVLDKRQGYLTAIEIINPGSGYSSAIEPVIVEVFGQGNFDESGDSLVESVLKAGDLEGGVPCQSNFVAEAIIDRQVGGIEIIEPGDGYATSVPLSVEIQAPGECGGRPDGTQAFGVGLIASGIARDDSKNKLPVPGTSVTSKLAQMLPIAVSDTLTINESGRYESLDLVDLPPTDSKEFVGKKAFLGTKREASNSMFDPVFGPVGRSPLEKESVLTVEDYLKLATAGAACNAVVRFFLHPLDCVKTTVQAEMGTDAAGLGLDVSGADVGDLEGLGGPGWLSSLKGILRKGGTGELLRGIDVSTLLGFMLGFIGFGGTEFFRREMERMMEMLDSTSSTPVGVILLASALAQVVSCLVTCPLEAVRIRVMTCDKRPEFLSFVGTAKEMLEEKGLLYFWSGLPALLFRELPFAIAKFLTFELVRNKIFEEIPAAQESVFSALVVSIVAGMMAGVAGAIVSQPADTVLTRLNTTVKKDAPAQPQLAAASSSSSGASSSSTLQRPWGPSVKPLMAGAAGVRPRVFNSTDIFRRDVDMGEVRQREREASQALDDLGEERDQSLDWKEVVRDMFEGQGGAMSLFSGLGLRAVFFGAAIALQFFAFDYFKALLKVSPDDLKLVLDVFADRVSFYTTGGQDLL